MSTIEMYIAKKKLFQKQPILHLPGSHKAGFLLAQLTIRNTDGEKMLEIIVFQSIPQHKKDDQDCKNQKGRLCFSTASLHRTN